MSQKLNWVKVYRDKKGFITYELQEDIGRKAIEKSVGPTLPKQISRGTLEWILRGEWKYQNGFYRGIRKRMKFIMRHGSTYEELFEALHDKVIGIELKDFISHTNLELWRWVKVIAEYKKWKRRDDMMGRLLAEDDLPPGYKK